MTIKLHKCPDCDERFLDESNLKIHIKSHFNPNATELKLGDISQLNQYNKKERIQKDRNQRIQSKASITNSIGKDPSSSIAKNLRNVSSGLRCRDCGKPFSNDHDLEEHKESHDGEPPFACYICIKEFKRRKTLISHMRLHTGNQVIV